MGTDNGLCKVNGRQFMKELIGFASNIHRYAMKYMIGINSISVIGIS